MEAIEHYLGCELDGCEHRQLTRYDFTVSVTCGSLEQAEQVMAERLGFDEDYGFPYQGLVWAVDPACL